MRPNAPRVVPYRGDGLMWPAAQSWRAPAADFPPLWAQAWGDDAYGLWADLQIGEVTQRLRWIEPSGRHGFLMGSPAAERRALSDPDLRSWADSHESEPQRVEISDGFWMADTPCTQALWVQVTGLKSPSHFRDTADAAQRPVESVNWDDVQKWLSTLTDRRPDLAGRAAPPTELQWEYAARASTTTAYPWGDMPNDERANWGGRHDGTTPVGSFAPNSWGLFDMHGNVWEWCDDAWRKRLHDEPQDPELRAVRGGSWFDHPGFARSAYRGWRHRGYRYLYQGFRFVLRSSSQDSPPR